MFWKFNLLATSHIDTLLNKEGLTLHELMDEDDILQECKAQNRKLIDFLVQHENITELVRLITEEPSDDLEEKVKYRYPNTACELLTSDVAQISETLAGDVELVKKLYSFIDTESTLNPLLASFFSKVMGLLITRKSEMILDFLKSRNDFVGMLLRHIGTSAIMDLLLRLLTCIESPEVKLSMHAWLNEQQIVQKLVNCITPVYDEDIHCNAAQTLCDIIRLGREHLIQFQERSEQDLLLSVVEMQDNITHLLDNMLSGEKSESVIVNGVTVIQTLFEFKKQSPEEPVEQMTTLDSEQMSPGIIYVLNAICPRLEDFHNILLDPPRQRFSVMPTTIGLLDPPLGNTRLQISKLIASLLTTNTHSINVELARLGTMNILLNLYFKYLWNNFLHTYVTQCVNTILNNPATEVDGKKECPLLTQLFKDGQLIQRVLQEWDCNDREQKLVNGKRKGFMGHLIKMANDIIGAQGKGENGEVVKALISDLPADIKERWESFLSGSLAEANKKNTVDLVQGHGHGLTSSSEDDDTDFGNIPFPQDTAMQQAFSDYQLQQMTSNFIDQFGFNEEEFAEHEEKSDSPFREKISSIDFSGSVSDKLHPSTSRFEQYCNERLPQFDNDSDEDIWEEKEITYLTTAPNQKRIDRLPVSHGSNEDSDRSTDSEEELDSPQHIVQQPTPAEKMDIDSNEARTKLYGQQAFAYQRPINWNRVPGSIRIVEEKETLKKHLRQHCSAGRIPQHKAWAGNFEEQGTQAGPVAMDTSPWDGSASLESKSSVALPDATWADFSTTKNTEQVKEKWAEFTNKIPEESGEKTKENWAIFTNFDSLKSDPRSSSPVDMDTMETSSRTNSYLTYNKEVELKLESVDTNEESKDIGTDIDKHVVDTCRDRNDSNAQSHIVNTNTASDLMVNQNRTNAVNSTKDGRQVLDISKPAHIPTALIQSVQDKPPTPPTSPPPDDEDCDVVLKFPKTSVDTGTFADTQAQGDGCTTEPFEQLEEGAGLDDNFDFLTKVGLMKPRSAPNCQSFPVVVAAVEAEIKENGPNNDIPVDKLEELRSLAKDALDSYDTATMASAAGIQNGPV